MFIDVSPIRITGKTNTPGAVEPVGVRLMSGLACWSDDPIKFKGLMSWSAFASDISITMT